VAGEEAGRSLCRLTPWKGAPRAMHRVHGVSKGRGPLACSNRGGGAHSTQPQRLRVAEGVTEGVAEGVHQAARVPPFPPPGGRRQTSFWQSPGAPVAWAWARLAAALGGRGLPRALRAQGDAAAPLARCPSHSHARPRWACVEGCVCRRAA